MTNAEFIKDEYFIKCCEAVNIEPSVRQASKFRNKQGLAYKLGRKKIVQEIK